MSRFQTVAINAQHGHTVVQDLWHWVKAQTMGGHKVSIEAKHETRTTAQNRLLHSRISDVAGQKEWAAISCGSSQRRYRRHTTC